MFNFSVKIKFVKLLLLCSFVWVLFLFYYSIIYLLGVIANIFKCDLTINDLSNWQADALQLKLLEKDKQLSSLEWQLVDAEATIASLHAERDRLALELDCAVGKEQDDLHVLGAVGDMPSNDPLEHLEYGLVESGYVDDMPVRRVRKQPRRHLSDLTSRGSSHVEDFGAVFIGTSSFSDYDVPHLAEKEYNGLGGLKRANNFSDINNLDEHEVFDRRASEAALNSVGKWESFDEPDGDLLLSSKNKCGGDIEGIARKVNNRRDQDMWTFTPDSIINVSTGTCRYLMITHNNNILSSEIVQWEKKNDSKEDFTFIFARY